MSTANMYFVLHTKILYKIISLGSDKLSKLTLEDNSLKRRRRRREVLIKENLLLGRKQDFDGEITPLYFAAESSRKSIRIASQKFPSSNSPKVIKLGTDF
jgi:hypothetical protein